MTKFSFEKRAELEAERIYEKLAKTEPGSKEYRELQNQLGAYEIMKEKRNSGSISKSQWVKFCVEWVLKLSLVGVMLTADLWAPRIMEKIKIGETISRLIK